MVHTSNRPPSPEQRAMIQDSCRRDIRAICAAWPAALDESQAHGYGSGFDPNGTGITGKTVGDPTGDRAMRPDEAHLWLSEARRTLALLLKLADTSRVRNERQWTGSFDPSRLTESFCAAADEIIDTWPLRVQRILDRLTYMASTAAAKWPPTPRKGQVIDGIEVGKSAPPLERCVECGDLILATVTDPLARIDGNPYHRKPCYNTVYVRRRRAVAS